MAENITDPLDIIYTPQQIVTIGTSYLDERRKNKGAGIPLGLASIDKDFLPALPGELITVIGRPGNGKTGFMMRWARWRAEQLHLQGIEDRVVVYATWEQSIEELYAFNVAADARLSVSDMARGDITDEEWEEAMEAGAQRIRLPLWFIGHSLARRKRRPRLTMDTLAMALQEIERWNEDKTQIDMVFVDYLQRIKFDGKPESKTIGTSEVLDRLKDGALANGCPFVVGVQAIRDVDQQKPPVPNMDDGQWTSNIEQTSDKIFSLVRPRRYKKEGEQFGKANKITVEGYCQMLVCLLKQKLGVDNKAYWVYFDPAYNKLDELEMRNVELNGNNSNPHWSDNI